MTSYASMVLVEHRCTCVNVDYQSDDVACSQLRMFVSVLVFRQLNCHVNI